MGLKTGFALHASDRGDDGSRLAVHLYPDDKNPIIRLWTVPGILCYSTNRPSKGTIRRHMVRPNVFPWRSID